MSVDYAHENQSIVVGDLYGIINNNIINDY